MRKLLYIMLFTLIMCACSTQKSIVEVPVEVIKEVPVEVIKTEYIYNTVADSTFEKDSVDRYREGDTLYIYREHIKYRVITKTDSVVRNDTVPKIIKVEVPKVINKEVVKEVNHIRWYQKALMWIGGIVSLLLIGFMIYKMKFKQWK